MLRKLISLAVTAVIVKQAWDRMKAMPAQPVVTPAASPDDVESEAVQNQPIVPASPMHYH
ncbi:MAG: hypothetical protein ABW067_00005 [Rhizobacter sp.]